MWGLSPPKGWLPQGSSIAAPARDQAQKVGISTLWWWWWGSLLWEGGQTQKGSWDREHREIAACWDLCLHQGQEQAISYPSPSAYPGAQPCAKHSLIYP